MRTKRRVIWKFILGTEAVIARASAGAAILLVGKDPATGQVAIWLENDPDAEQVDRLFVIYGTGVEIDGDGRYPFDQHVGSVVDGPFVWHVYERGRPYGA